PGDQDRSCRREAQREGYAGAAAAGAAPRIPCSVAAPTLPPLEDACHVNHCVPAPHRGKPLRVSRKEKAAGDGGLGSRRGGTRRRGSVSMTVIRSDIWRMRAVKHIRSNPDLGRCNTLAGMAPPSFALFKPRPSSRPHSRVLPQALRRGKAAVDASAANTPAARRTRHTLAPVLVPSPRSGRVATVAVGGSWRRCSPKERRHQL